MKCIVIFLVLTLVVFMTEPVDSRGSRSFKSFWRKAKKGVDKVTTDEELEEMLHRDNLAIFISDVSSNARISSQALSEIESRHQDIISLESSIRELHEIFADTAMLLEIQGELINNIEKNVTSAAEYVDKSKAETYKAVTYKKNPHKIASLPSFFKPFKRKTTATDQNPSDSNHD